MPDPITPAAEPAPPIEPAAPAAAPAPALATEPSAPPSGADAAIVLSLDGGPAPATPPAEPSAPEPAALKAHTDTPGLLTEKVEVETPTEEKPADAPKEGDKPAEPAKEGETPKPEGETPAVEAPPPEPLSYAETPLKLPENVTLDAERAGEFDAILGRAQVPAEARQELADLYLKDRETWDASTLQRQHDIFAETRKGWRTEAMADPELGGAGFQTNRAAAIRMIEAFVPEARREAFAQMLDITGASDHPEMFRFLTSIARKFDEPGAPPPTPKPPSTLGQRSGRASANELYDHPTSQPGARS